MSKKLWTDKELADLKESFDTCPTLDKAIERHKGIYPGRTTDSIKWARRQNFDVTKKIALNRTSPETIEEKLELTKLKKEISSLKCDLQEAYKRASTTDSLRELIHDIKKHDFDTQPKWIHKKRNVATHGTPTLLLSDVHFDEFVHREQVNNLNEYNNEIATKRINFTFEKAVDMLMNTYSKPSYDGFHLCLNGDMLSGNIHEELRETNCQPILKSIVSLEEILIQNIKNLADVFGSVFVTCLPGNHGRLDKKPRAKNRVFDNYEWILYHHTARFFNGDDRVTFLIPDSWECSYEIYNQRFFQTHGDTFKGGSGIGGILIPILRGLAKKQNTYSHVGKPFQVAILGHFHQLIMMDDLVINGTTKGYDEWVMQMGFPYQRPQQALWINHPEHGMVLKSKIMCDGYQGGFTIK